MGLLKLFEKDLNKKLYGFSKLGGVAILVK